MNINKLNALIEEYKKDDPKNIKHDGYCFSNGCFVNAFITYPQITSDILLKLMCLVVYCIGFRSCKTPEDIRDLILSTLIYNKD